MRRPPRYRLIHPFLLRQMNPCRQRSSCRWQETKPRAKNRGGVWLERESACSCLLFARQAESCHEDFRAMDLGHVSARVCADPMRRQSKPFVTAVLGAIAAIWLPAARAAETEFFVALHYGVDSSVRGCSDEAEFRRDIMRQLGYDPFRIDATTNISVRVGGTTRGVDGQIEWRSATGKGIGERHFLATNGNCSNLLTEMSFAVALQIQLLRTMAPASSSVASSASEKPASTDLPMPPATVPVAAQKPDVVPSVSERNPGDSPDSLAEPAVSRSSSRWPMWLGIGPSMAWGISPSLTASARLFFGVRRDNLSLEIGAEASLPSTARRTDSSGFRENLVGASVATCAHRWVMSACALGKVGQVRVSGFGVDQPRSAAGIVGQAGLRLAATLQFGGPWSATAHLDALGLLTPYTVELNRVGLWEMPRLGALAGIDLTARFR